MPAQTGQRRDATGELQLFLSNAKHKKYNCPSPLRTQIHGFIIFSNLELKFISYVIFNVTAKSVVAHYKIQNQLNG